jgi:hypothetical protein
MKLTIRNVPYNNVNAVKAMVAIALNVTVGQETSYVKDDAGTRYAQGYRACKDLWYATDRVEEERAVWCEEQSNPYEERTSQYYGFLSALNDIKHSMYRRINETTRYELCVDNVGTIDQALLLRFAFNLAKAFRNCEVTFN